MARIATFLLALLGSSLIASGCAAQSPPATPASGPLAVQMNPGCDPMTKKCFIKVHVLRPSPNPTYRIEPDNADVGKDNPNSEFCISWQLQGDYVFYPQLGDGVFFKGDDKDEFWDNDTTEDSDCGKTSHGADVKRYRWRYLNTKPMQTYSYKVLFHKKGDKTFQYSVDPTISNTGTH